MEVKTNDALLYTVAEVAAILKVNKNTVYHLIDCGYLKAMKLGCKKITRMALLDFLKKYENFDFKQRNDTEKD